MTAGDLNGDELTDLVVADAAGDNLAVLLSLGDGAFQSPSFYAMADRPTSVAIGDLNGDQIPDLVVANVFSDTIAILMGLGAGALR